MNENGEYGYGVQECDANNVEQRPNARNHKQKNYKL